MVEWPGTVSRKTKGSTSGSAPHWTGLPAGLTSGPSRWRCGMISFPTCCRTVRVNRREVSTTVENEFGFGISQTVCDDKNFFLCGYDKLRLTLVLYLPHRSLRKANGSNSTKTGASNYSFVGTHRWEYIIYSLFFLFMCGQHFFFFSSFVFSFHKG